MPSLIQCNWVTDDRLLYCMNGNWQMMDAFGHIVPLYRDLNTLLMERPGHQWHIKRRQTEFGSN